MKESSDTGFGKCVLGEVIGYGAGEGIGSVGAGAVTGALAGVYIDQAYGSARGAYESYQQHLKQSRVSLREIAQSNIVYLGTSVEPLVQEAERFIFKLG